MDFFIQMINGLGLGSIYALVALGYSMVYGIIQLINFAHGDIIMVGGYVVFVVMVQLGLPLWAAVILSIAVCTLLGVVIERLAYHRLLVKDAPRLSLLITAIGVSIFPAKSISAWLYLQRSVDAGDVPQQGDYPRQPATKL